MTGKALEKILKNNLTSYFSTKGYVFFHEYENSYFTCKGNLYDAKLEIQAKSRSIGYAEFTITFWNIENIISEIGLPGISEERLKKISPFFTTVHDKNILNCIKYDDMNPVETEEECKLYCQRIIGYMETDGKAFIEKYSYLPNVLAEMDRLESEGKYWKEIICGGPEFLLKGLIVSKLCNDDAYLHKCKYVKELYLSMANEYIYHYEKLKERLKTIEPIYNI